MAKNTEAPKMPSLNLVELGETASKTTKEGSTTLDMIKRAAINTTEKYQWAAKAVAEIKEARNKAETMRKSAVDPLGGVIKLINGWFKPGIEALDEAEAVLKKKMVDFSEASEEKRDKLIRAAGKSSSRSEREELLEKADEHVTPEIEGITKRVTWTGEVENAKKIPREYLIPDVKALLALTRAKGGDPEIPGWKAYPNTSVAVDTDKVER